jgi:hypothetical protein
MVSRLLSHYWTADDRVEERQAQIEDWIDDLSGFGPDIAAEACARWRIYQSRRPTPADVRKEAVQVQAEYAERAALSSPEVIQDRQNRHDRRRQQKEERERRNRIDQAEGRDIVNKWAQERGFADLDAYCEATARPWPEVYTQIVQEICGASPFPARIGSFRLLADAIGGGRPHPPARAPSMSPGEALGVKVREYSAEELAAGRRQLGLEEQQ